MWKFICGECHVYRCYIFYFYFIFVTIFSIVLFIFTNFSVVSNFCNSFIASTCNFICNTIYIVTFIDAFFWVKLYIRALKI